MGAESRRIPPEVDCRVPPASKISPSPRVEERVIFLSHLQRGFGLPASPFFHQFLEFFGLQSHHLSPNVLVFLSAFVSFFEGYLDIWPQLHHWTKYFNFRAQTVQGREAFGSLRRRLGHP